MLTITLPSRPSLSQWEQVEALLARGRLVVLRSADGQHAALRPAIARLGVLDVTDGGPAGLELHPTRS